MKKFIFLLASLFAFVAATEIKAQSYIASNIDERIVRRVSTTEDESTKADSIIIADNEAGIIQIKVIGLHTAGSDPITGTLQYSYSKANGTLTLGTSRIVDTVRVDTDISGATFAATSAGNNIKITVTGVASKPIRWAVITKKWARRND